MQNTSYGQEGWVILLLIIGVSEKVENKEKESKTAQVKTIKGSYADAVNSLHRSDRSFWYIFGFIKRWRN